MARVVVVACLLAVACGRVRFDELADVDGAGDALLDATVCDDNLPGVVFCEPFEGPPMLTFAQAMAPSSVGPDDTRAYRGVRSLHCHATRAAEPAWLVDTVLPDIKAGELYARWYQYIPASPAQIDMSTLRLIETAPPYGGFSFQVDSAGVAVDASATFARLPFAIARDAWTCVQARIVISDTAGSMETWLDGQVGPAVSGVDTLPVGGYDDVHAGIYTGPTFASPEDLWLDEIVVGTAPIPCD